MTAATDAALIPADAAPQELVTVCGRLTSRRRLSAKLVFYDLQRLPDAAAAAASREWVELVLKADVCGGVERCKELRDSLKLGDVVEVTGHADDSGSIQAVSIVVLQPWREQSPGSSFVPQPAPHHRTARQRLPLQQLCGSGDAGAGSSSSTQEQAAAAAGPARSADAKVCTPQVQVCKFWVNTRACVKGSACPFLHPPLPAARAGTRRRAGSPGGTALPAAAADAPSRTQWLAERLQARRVASEGAGFVHAASAAARRRRATVLAAWLVQTYGVEVLNAGAGVLDVAGGRGALTFDLAVLHGVRCTLVDPRPLRLTKFQHRHLKEAGRVACIHSTQLQPCGAEGAAGSSSATNQGSPKQQQQPQAGESSSSSRCDGGSDSDGMPGQQQQQQQPEGASEAAAAAAVHLHHVQAHFGPELWDQPAWQARYGSCSLVVGLHPDQATDAIVDFAMRQRVPFVVVPCCVFPRLFPGRRVRVGGSGDDGGGVLRPVTSYPELVQHLLQRREGAAQTAVLPFEGANIVVWSSRAGAAHGAAAAVGPG